MRGDEHARQVPQRVAGRQRLRVGHVQRRRAAGPARSSATSASVTTSEPRAALTSSAPSFIRARKRGVHHADGLRGDRGEQRPPRRPSGSSAGQFADRGHATVAGAGRATRRTLHLEPGQPPLHRRADRAVPDDQHGLAGQAVGELVAPPLRPPAPGRSTGTRAARPGSRATTHSAVLASCTPRALHRVTPAGMYGRSRSTPGGQRLHHGQARAVLRMAAIAGWAGEERRHVELDLGRPVAGSAVPSGTTTSTSGGGAPGSPSSAAAMSAVGTQTGSGQDWLRRSRISSRTRRRRPGPGGLHHGADQHAGRGDLAGADLVGHVGVRGHGVVEAAASAPSSLTTARPRAATTSSGRALAGQHAVDDLPGQPAFSAPESTSSATRATWAGVIGSSASSTPRSLACRASSPSHQLRASAGAAPAATVSATRSSAPALRSGHVEVGQVPLGLQPGPPGRGQLRQRRRGSAPPTPRAGRPAPGPARGSTGSPGPLPCCGPAVVMPVSSWKCRVSWTTRPPGVEHRRLPSISKRTARSTERSEFTFLVSVRVPQFREPAWAAARC